MSKMDLYTATSIAEGFCGYDPTAMQELQAWAYLVKTGACWKLQGWYGRNAESLIESGFISKRGTITKHGRQVYGD